MAFKIVSLVLGLTLTLASATAARDALFKPSNNLDATPEANTSLVDCWNALVEIKSCSNEIILFFLHGQTNINIGADCCRAISTITHNCWPAMLTSIGFTAEQGNILRGYCDYEASITPVASPPLAAGPSK